VTTQLPLSLGHRSAHGDTDFLVAPCNQDAVAWLDRWPDWPGQTTVIYGPARCGKTHLAHVWQSRSGARLIAPKHLTTDALPDILEGVNAFVIDDVDEQMDELALLHLHNMLGERAGHLLLTSSVPPARWNIQLKDLQSRMNAAPAVAVGFPDDALIGSILIKLFADRQLHIGIDVIGFLVARIERSFASVHRIVRLLDEAALAGHRRITVPLARDVVSKLAKEEE
jgi:chromosomal replication initiation ATPase DnaA